MQIHRKSKNVQPTFRQRRWHVVGKMVRLRSRCASLLLIWSSLWLWTIQRISTKGCQQGRWRTYTSVQATKKLGTTGPEQWSAFWIDRPLGPLHNLGSVKFLDSLKLVPELVNLLLVHLHLRIHHHIVLTSEPTACRGDYRPVTLAGEKDNQD
eukprot:2405561-Amphidinium_carterae.2